MLTNPVPDDSLARAKADCYRDRHLFELANPDLKVEDTGIIRPRPITEQPVVLDFSPEAREVSLRLDTIVETFGFDVLLRQFQKVAMVNGVTVTVEG